VEAKIYNFAFTGGSVTPYLHAAACGG
jgi:hypothetical protein